ncbi:dynein intermediate chain 1, axonemal [Caerostris extrusa]|uniref:Dynein intermediate chain 1, axonemal n=1 Tax=Caerostris extrusa TaxID=172846 RepID=A0AAV4WUN9_CAEEX|nr:dynein intermediate chain 1, axonemal [Caerostris extrusa]
MVKKEDDEEGWLTIDLVTLLKKMGRKEIEFKENCRKYLKLCERMLDQNSSQANLDFNYYNNPNDEFTPNVGTLLPLWRLSLKDVNKMPVTTLNWNQTYTDLFAVGFRMMRKEGEEEDEQEEDDLGLVREAGCLCVLSLKSPSYPEKILPSLWG